jgi:hypothetical protein
MYLILTSSKDSYITNKIIENKFRATDANVGKAGTIDIFKLYEESTFLSGSTRITGSIRENSTGLIKFDFEKLNALTSSNLDINSSRFSAKLKMYDILGGQATPSNYSLVTYPLSMSFDEGIGSDVTSFSDLDVCNYITASYSSGSPVLWHMSGANSHGYLGSSNIDYITSGSIGGEEIDFGSTQYFKNGNEDLDLDITTFVSSALANNISNFGLRLSFSGSDYTDNKTRFVKRFASRHSSNLLKVPQVHISWDDNVVDNHEDFIFDVSGSLFLKNYVRGIQSNLLSGSSATEITGNSCMKLKLQVQDYSKNINVSQHSGGTGNNFTTGIYSASFAISSFDSSYVNSSNETIRDLINKNGFVSFKTYWISLDESVGFHTGSISIKDSRIESFKKQPSDLNFNFINLNPEYSEKDEVYIKIFVEDLSLEEKAYKIPRSKKSLSLSKAYYRIREVYENKVVIPFGESNDSTKLNSDSEGLSFLFHMSNLPKGFTYCFDVLIKDYGENKIFKEASGRFKVI